MSLERRVEHAGGEYVAGARENVLGRQFDALGQQGVVFGKALDGIEGRLSQAGFMGAAGWGGDQVDVRFARQIAFGIPADCPRRAGAGREVFIAGRGVFFGGEDRRRQFAFKLFGEVLLHAVGKTPGFRFAAFERQRDFEAGKQHGLAAQQPFEFGDGDVG